MMYDTYKLAEIEKDLLTKLVNANFTIEEISEKTGVCVRTLYKKLSLYEIQTPKMKAIFDAEEKAKNNSNTINLPSGATATAITHGNFFSPFGLSNIGHANGRTYDPSIYQNLRSAYGDFFKTYGDIFKAYSVSAPVVKKVVPVISGNNKHILDSTPKLIPPSNKVPGLKPAEAKPEPTTVWNSRTVPTKDIDDCYNGFFSEK